MKYFKILNQFERSRGMIYKTGLNTDILSFNPTGDCEPGGIYFASKDIFVFCNHGPWVREVTLPEDEEIYQSLDGPLIYKSHRVILGERKKLWDLKTIKWMIENGANIDAGDKALSMASARGDLEIVKFLVKNVTDINASDGIALRSALVANQPKIIEFLMQNGAVHHAI